MFLCFNPLYAGHKLKNCNVAAKVLYLFQSPICGSQTVVIPRKFFAGELFQSPICGSQTSYFSAATCCPGEVSIPYMRVTNAVLREQRMLTHAFQSPICGSQTPALRLDELSLAGFQSPICGSQTMSVCKSLAWLMCFNPLYAGHKRYRCVCRHRGV